MTFTTRARVKERLSIPSGTTDFDAVIDTIIGEVNAMVDDLIGRDLDETTHTEYYNGSGTDTLLLRQGPLVSVTSVHSVVYEDGGGGSRSETTTELTQANRLEWGLRSEGYLGQCAIVYNSGTFTRGKRNWKVVYDAGFASAPETLAKAATYEACAEFLARESQGLVSKIIGEAQQSVMTMQQRRRALEAAISPYRIPVAA